MGGFSDRVSLMSHQYELLGLFDGISGGKKLFVLTCNNLSSINSFLINRPGRIHYHIRFSYPLPAEIKAYLEDNLKPEYRREINTIINYSFVTKMSYDSLRALVFEVNTGLSTEEAVRDLNISMSRDGSPQYGVYLRFRNRTSRPRQNSINFFSGGDIASVEMTYRRRKMKQRILSIQFMLDDLTFDDQHMHFVLPADKIIEVTCMTSLDDEEMPVPIEDLLEQDGLEYIVFDKLYS